MLLNKFFLLEMSPLLAATTRETLLSVLGGLPPHTALVLSFPLSSLSPRSIT